MLLPLRRLVEPSGNSLYEIIFRVKEYDQKPPILSNWDRYTDSNGLIVSFEFSQVKGA